MNNRIKQVLYTIVENFKSGDIPDAVAMATFPMPDVPSNKWSFTNRTLMFLSGTFDARGFRQWQEVNRWIKKGSKAIYILVPCFKKETDDTGDEKEQLKFFRAMPVFRYEDTEGQDLHYTTIKLPDLPLIERAEEWGISVKAIPGHYKYYGFYSPDKNEICLATPEESVFFHELAHAAHEKIIGNLKKEQDPFQEIIAELSSQALCRLVGKKAVNSTGNSYRYIESYAKKAKHTVYSACLKVMSETEKVLNLILKGK